MPRQDDVRAAGGPADIETKARPWRWRVERIKRSGVASRPRMADLMRERVGDGRFKATASTPEQIKRERVGRLTSEHSSCASPLDAQTF